MSIFEKILSLFFINPEDPKYKLRLIKKEILRESPRYFNPKKKILTRLFAKDLYFFYKELSYFHKPISNIFSNSSTKFITAKIFLSSLIDKDVLKYLNLLEPIKVKVIYEKYGLNKTVAYYDKIFNMIKNEINFEVIKEIDKILAVFRSFLDLIEFNFRNFLSEFDVRLKNPVIKGLQINFEDVKVTDKIKENLSDLTFLIKNFRFEQNFLNLLLIYLRRYYKIKGEKFQKEIAIKKFRTIEKIILENFRYEKLENYLKIMNEDPFYEIKVIPFKPENFLEKELNIKIEKIKREIEKISDEERNKFLQAQMRSIFKDHEILTSPYYSETLSKTFLTLDLTGLRFVNLFNIAKTFIIYFYEGKFKNTISTLIFKANFLDNELQTQLNNSFHSCNELINKVNDFEESVKSLEKIYNTILKKPEAIRKSDSIRANFSLEIENANNLANKLLIDVYYSFKPLYETLNIIHEDFKKGSSQRIANLMTNFNPLFFQNLNTFIVKLKNFLYILEKTLKLSG